MPVLDRTTRILDVVCDAPGPISLADIARKLQQPRSSVHRLVIELAAAGLLTRLDGASYLPGPRLIRWGEAARNALDLARISRPTLERLRDRTGESVRLYVRDGNERVCTAAVEGSFELRHVAQVGRRLPLRVGAAGKLLLAFADPATQSAELALAVTDPLSASAPSGRELERQLAEIRDTGWSVSMAEREEGLAAAAAAVRDLSGDVVAALAISGPSSRLSDEYMAAIGPMVREMAGTLSEALGFGLARG